MNDMTRRSKAAKFSTVTTLVTHGTAIEARWRIVCCLADLRTGCLALSVVTDIEILYDIHKRSGRNGCLGHLMR